jgi:hypothetical protein
VPWEHCGQSLTDDMSVCPKCSAQKGKWTTKLGHTRLFTIAGNEWEPGQAETLRTAQDSGAPFCEECQAAENQEQEDEEPEDPPEEDEDDDEDEDAADHEAQAETLKQAGDSGSPFCEECQKAENQPDDEKA